MVKQIDKALKQLKIDEDQLLAFQGGFVGEIAFSEVFARGRFEFTKKNPNPYIPFRSVQKGRLHYTMILPFYAKNRVKVPCVDNAYLPLFYKNKGVKN